VLAGLRRLAFDKEGPSVYEVAPRSIGVQGAGVCTWLYRFQEVRRFGLPSGLRVGGESTGIVRKVIRGRA
jgi:hypothetical protein